MIGKTILLFTIAMMVFLLAVGFAVVTYDRLREGEYGIALFFLLALLTLIGFSLQAAGI